MGHVSQHVYVIILAVAFKIKFYLTKARFVAFEVITMQLGASVCPPVRSSLLGCGSVRASDRKEKGRGQNIAWAGGVIFRNGQAGISPQLSPSIRLRFTRGLPARRGSVWMPVE